MMYASLDSLESESRSIVELEIEMKQSVRMYSPEGSHTTPTLEVFAFFHSLLLSACFSRGLLGALRKLWGPPSILYGHSFACCSCAYIPIA